MQTSAISTRLLVGGCPRNSPKLVPCDMNRVQLYRHRQIVSSTSSVQSGKAARRDASENPAMASHGSCREMANEVRCVHIGDPVYVILAPDFRMLETNDFDISGLLRDNRRNTRCRHHGQKENALVQPHLCSSNFHLDCYLRKCGTIQKAPTTKTRQVVPKSLPQRIADSKAQTKRSDRLVAGLS